MTGCFTAGVCYNLGKKKKNHVILPKNVNFVVTNIKKGLNCGNHFLAAWCKFFNPKSINHACYEVSTYFQKAITGIHLKYVVTFRISCLLTILSEVEKNFNMSSR